LIVFGELGPCAPHKYLVPEVLAFPLNRALKLSDILAEAGVRLGHYSVFGGVLSQRQAGADVV
jgi:hypothetical protein